MVKTTVVRREKIRKMIFFASLVSINKLCFISRREWGKILAGRHKLFAPFDGWADKRKAAKRNLRIKQENNFIVKHSDIQIKCMLEWNVVEGTITLSQANSLSSYQFSLTFHLVRPNTIPFIITKTQTNHPRNVEKKEALQIMENVSFVVFAAFSSYAFYVWSNSKEANENVRSKHSFSLSLYTLRILLLRI